MTLRIQNSRLFWYFQKISSDISNSESSSSNDDSSLLFLCLELLLVIFNFELKHDHYSLCWHWAAKQITALKDLISLLSAKICYHTLLKLITISSCLSNIVTAHNLMINLHIKMLLNSFVDNNLKSIKISKSSLFCAFKIIFINQRAVDKELSMNS